MFPARLEVDTQRDFTSVKRRFAKALFGIMALLVMIGVAPMAHALSVTDDLGNKVKVDEPVERIASLAPSVTEIVYAAGAGSKLVAVSAYSDWPAAARKLPQIGDAFRVDLERLAALQPDLVIAWASATSPLERRAIKRLGFPLLLLAPHKLTDIPRELRLVGKATGTDEVAKRAARAFSRERKRLSRVYRHRPTVRVFYEISPKPLYTIGGKQIISQVISLCGGHNVFSDLDTLAPVVSQAAVLARNPQVILVGKSPRAHSALNAWKQWAWLTAVKRKNLFTVPGTILGRATPRILEGALAVCRALDTARRHL